MKNETGPILLFDGLCNLCNASVQFVLKHDNKSIFRFASLQSATAAALLLNSDQTAAGADSVILILQNRVYTRSEAVIRTAILLGGIYKSAAIFYIIPRPLRDLLYKWIAKNRYHWFGKREQCMLPDKKHAGRFLT